MTNLSNSAEEIWKDIEGYEGLYKVSNLGRIQSNYRNKKILRNVINNKGYCQVLLKRDKVGKKFLVQRIVAKSFVKNPENLPYVNHIDCNPKNNNATNLEWCTQSYNQIFSDKNNNQARRIGEKCYRAKLTNRDVLNIVKLFSTKKNKEISVLYGVSIVTIQKIRWGKTWNEVTGISKKRF